EVGLAFVPTSLVMMICSLKVSDRLVMAYGIRPPLTVGLALAAVSLGLFMMGGALGLAVLVAVSDSRTASLLAGGANPVEALHGGLQIAFAVGAVAAA